MSVLFDLMDAVASELSAYGAVVEEIPEYELKDLKEEKVIVAPGGVEIPFETRSSVSEDYDIYVGFLKKIRSDSEIRTLMNKVEQIRAEFHPGAGRLSGYSSAICIGVSNVPLYSEEHIRSKNLFLSVIKLTFRVN